MVSDVTIQTAIDQQSSTSAASSALTDDFAQFLSLLTTQLQNQDPLSPMDSTEFTNQLVAFTQVEQQINTNQKLDSLVALNLSNTMSSAQSYVGTNVNYISSEFYFDGTPADLRYSLADAAEDVTVRIVNEEGATVYSEEMGSASGVTDFTWNGELTGGGTAADGTYEIMVDALNEEGDSVEATTVVSGRVKGVESQSGVIYLIVGERAVALGNVLNTTEASNASEATNTMTAALDYIGLDVGYANDELLLGSSGAATINYTLAADADRAKIKIYDDQGDLVFTDDVDTDKGSHSYNWDADGFRAGEYTFEIDAIAQGTTTIKNSEVSYDGGGKLKINYTLQTAADSVAVEVYDENGALVFTDDASQTSGAHTYTWDGDDNAGNALAAGDYTVKVISTSETDERIGVSSSAVGRVTGVEVDNGVISLQIGRTSIPLSDILSVSVPGEEDS